MESILKLIFSGKCMNEALIMSSPSSLTIEPTTRCNFSCAMCVKQVPGNEIENGDLSFSTFTKLEPAFGGLKKLIFSGIGEPLLHPELDRFIAGANGLMPKESEIGLQTNGFLLDEARLDSLWDSGLDVICVSLDAASPGTFKQIRAGGELGDIENAFRILKSAKSKRGPKSFRFGIEFVLMKQNYKDLPQVVRWAVENGASFAIVTNLIPYDQAGESECRYSPNTTLSADFYQRWKEKADDLNLDLDAYLKQRWKYHWKAQKTPEEQALADFGKEMLNEAYSKQIPLHTSNLIGDSIAELNRTKEILAEALEIARETGLDLTLPELSPKFERQCHFVEEDSSFISWRGEVYPCYFLWHQYSFFQNGRRVKVAEKSFGQLQKKPIREIWNSTDYRSFREKVLKYDYPFCENCNLGPCNLFTEKPFEYDCYANDIPCGCCPWCGGLLHCLR